MSQQFSPMSSSSSSHYLDNLSPLSQETSENNSLPLDSSSQNKRRRIDPNPDIAQGRYSGEFSSTAPNTWSCTSSFDSQMTHVPPLPGQGLFDMNPSTSSFWAWNEVDAIDYLASEHGFRRDLNNMPAYSNQLHVGSPNALQTSNLFAQDYNFQRLSNFAEVSTLPASRVEDVFTSTEKIAEAKIQPPSDTSRMLFPQTPTFHINPRPLPNNVRFDQNPRLQTSSIEDSQRVRSLPYYRNTPQPTVNYSHTTYKPSVLLTLTRATESSIADIPEHKRECPACKLEFEPENFIASISCCHTPMHATCFSAWVNSQTYAKAKVCMKCRKTIDARRPLNTVVPPVTDKIWDEGVDFNAPESLKETQNIEIDVSSRYERMGSFSRARRHAHHSYARRRRMINEEELPNEMRNTIQRMRSDDQKMLESLKVDCQKLYQDWSQAYDAEVEAAQAVTEAREALQTGQIRAGALHALVERCRNARILQEAKHEIFKSKSREQDRIRRDQQFRLNVLLDQMSSGIPG